MKNQKAGDLSYMKSLSIILLDKVISLAIKVLPMKLGLLFLTYCRGYLSKIIAVPNSELINDNLRYATKISDEKIHNLTENCLKQYMIRSMELMFCWNWQPRKIKKFISSNLSVEGKKFLDEAFAFEKGLILVSAHIGGYLILPYVLGYLGYNVKVLIRVDDRYRRSINKMGRLYNFTPIYISNNFSAGKSLVRYLKDKESVLILGDYLWNEKKKKDFCGEVFGVKVYIPKGPAWLNLRTGSPVVPIYLIRESKYRYKLLIYSPLSFEDHIGNISNNNELIRRIKAIHASTQRMIERYPEQWKWDEFKSILI